MLQINSLTFVKTEYEFQIDYIYIVKYFWAIFSIYITILSTIPCGDSVECNEMACTEEAICEDSACSDEIASNDTEKDCKDETCSPFCFCACCGCVGFNFNLSPLALVASIQPTNTITVIYDSQFLSQYVVNIWQPPRLS